MERVGWGGNGEGGGKDYCEDAVNVKSVRNGLTEAIPLDVSTLPTVALTAMQNMLCYILLYN
jgi:hypothetical protein